MPRSFQANTTYCAAVKLIWVGFAGCDGSVSVLGSGIVVPVGGVVVGGVDVEVEVVGGVVTGGGVVLGDELQLARVNKSAEIAVNAM